MSKTYINPLLEAERVRAITRRHRHVCGRRQRHLLVVYLQFEAITRGREVATAEDGIGLHNHVAHNGIHPNE